MQQTYLTTKKILAGFYMLFCSSIVVGQTTESNRPMSAIDMQKARKTVDSIDKQFSKDYLDGDSIALAAHYASDGQLGSLKGKDILSYWGKAIRNSIKDNTRNLIFTTTSLTTDSEYLVELGIYEIKDDKNNLKDKGKYLVVWKQETGQWKLYRDISL